jgi:hypothetical protein
LTGLLPNTTYYVRAYATNSAGTSYGSEVSFKTNADTTAPAGFDKTISSSNITLTGVRLSWNKATDDISAQAALQYLVYKSSENNLDNVADIEANGTAIGAFATDIALKDIGGLSAATTYYFNVIVKDEAEIKHVILQWRLNCSLCTGKL